MATLTEFRKEAEVGHWKKNIGRVHATQFTGNNFLEKINSHPGVATIDSGIQFGAEQNKVPRKIEC